MKTLHTANLNINKYNIGYLFVKTKILKQDFFIFPYFFIEYKYLLFKKQGLKRPLDTLKRMIERRERRRERERKVEGEREKER